MADGFCTCESAEVNKMTDHMRLRFEEAIASLVHQKKHNTVFLTSTRYEAIINDVLKAKAKEKGKTPREYKLLRRYDVITAYGETRLISPVKNNTADVKYFAPMSELFQIINDTHLRIRHGGRDRILKELNGKYKNIPIEAVSLYLKLCEVCEKKHQKPELTKKQIIFKEMNSRCQIDIIEFQAFEGYYRFILVYWDNLTKFIVLRPLKSQTTQEIAKVLIEIFNTFGAPSILQSGSGREFASEIVKEVLTLYPGLKILHGSDQNTSRSPDHQNIKSMLNVWLQDNPTKEWVEGLSFVQMKKNRTYQADMKCAPYEAMFGCPLKMGIDTNHFLPGLLDVTAEEDLERVLETANDDIFGN